MKYHTTKCYVCTLVSLSKLIVFFQQVFNAQLVPENTDLITDIIFPEVGDTQVVIPTDALIHQRTVEGA